MDVEAYRHKREILERIELALVARIRKSDEYLPQTVNPTRNHPGSREYSSRENAFRTWETRELVKIYHDLFSDLQSAKINTEVSDLDTDIKKAMAFDDDSPSEFEAKRWALNQEARGLERFTSEVTSQLPVAFHAEYPVPEHFGQQVWLEPFYNKLLASKTIPESQSYRDYLENLSEIYSDHNESELARYLEEAYDRAHDLGPGTETSAADALGRASIHEDALFCRVCVRQFANENVYKAHLSGKKHKRAASQTTSMQPSISQDSQSTSLPLQDLISLMQPQIKSTIAEIDRKSRMALRDRKLELETIEKERAAEDEWISDEEHCAELTMKRADSHGADAQDGTLRGPDGSPIPRWLYKLQGLGTTFKCEICGNVKYSGRKFYDRHFESPRHVSGLAEMGISMSPAYHGIGSVNEAKELAAKLMRSNRAAAEIEKEVEDDDGNVMNERMYEDLKKQGLI